MVARTLDELATDLRMRRTVGDRPAVLLLGAGASVDAGIGAMKELFEFFKCADFEAFSRYIGPTTPAERYRYLSEFLQTRTPSEVTRGYQALASLCAQGYFDLVLTTNMDPLLDDALAAARLWRRDYLLIVNGVIRPDRLPLLLGSQSPRVKILKLHGDLFQRFMAWTVPEMDTFLGEVSSYLTPAVAGRDFLVVGYSLRDARVRELVRSAGGSVWFTHPKGVPSHLEDEPSLRAVVAPECAFETFFPALARALEVKVPQAPRGRTPVEARAAPPAEAGAQTMDDLMASTFAVSGPGGVSSSTAFLVAEPRRILCDRFAAAPYVRREALELLGPGGSRFRARVLGAGEAHPFGPMVLEAPPDLLVPGLRVAAAPLKPGQAIQVLVAAGEKTGIGTGTVVKARLAPVAIAPIPAPVRDLAELACVVAPGSSGAPVVDDSMAVCGFVVAGSNDPRDPRSFAYPASHWARSLSPRAARTATRSGPRAKPRRRP